MGIRQKSLDTPEIIIKISVAIKADKYVPNGRNITTDSTPKRTMI